MFSNFERGSPKVERECGSGGVGDVEFWARVWVCRIPSSIKKVKSLTSSAPSIVFSVSHGN